MTEETGQAASLDALCSYFMELDSLKLVNRRTYIGAGERLENSAEHSWHLAMACWAVARHFELKVSEEKLLKLALVHDLGEIDAGDTFLYASNRDTAHTAERKCVARLTKHRGNPVAELAELWEEQETGASKETRLLKAVDRLLPFLHNIASEGKTWRELGVKKTQVMAAHAFIETDFPELHFWMASHIQHAVHGRLAY